MLHLLWLSVVAYFVLQTVVLWFSSGPTSWVAGLPLLVMVPIIVLTIGGLLQDIDRWSSLLLVASPVALLYVIGAAFFVMRRKSVLGM